MKILFIGATGLLGKPVAKELINAGHDLTLIARNERKVSGVFPGANVVQADVFDLKSLEKAFPGFDAVYINLSVDQNSGKKDKQPEKEGIENVIIAAKKSGIKRIIYLSSLIKNYQGINGFNWWAFDVKQRAVENIKESRIPYSIFYPSSFMDTFTQLIKGNNLLLVSGSKQQMWFIAAADYGKQVVRALEIAKDSSQEYIIQGTEPYTWDEAADIVVRNYSRTPLKIRKAPLGLLKFLGIFNPRIRYGVKIITALNNYPEEFQSDKTWNELGRPQITLAEFASNL